MADRNGTTATPTTATAAPRGPGLTVRLTDAERAAWHAAARSAGYGKTAAWVREVVADRLTGRGAAEVTGRVTGRGAEGAGLSPEVAAALGRIGNNVNQMARAANTAERAGEVSPLTVEAVEALRLEVAQLRDDLRAGRGERG